MKTSQEDKSSDDFRDRHYPLHEDMRLQCLTWRMERFGWWFLAAAVVFAILGAFSDGLLSSAQVKNADGNLSVEYDRFERRGGQSDITLHVKAGDDGEAIAELGKDFLKNFTIDHVQPAPAHAETRNGALRWTFPTEKDQWVTVYLALRPAGMGTIHQHIAVPGSEAVRFTQFIYP